MLEQAIVRALRIEAQPLTTPGDLDLLMELVRDANLVLLGEASHGTREFYRIRAEITRRLIVAAPAQRPHRRAGPAHRLFRARPVQPAQIDERRRRRGSHYFHADLAHQFDAVIHIDRSSAVKPLEYSAHWTAEKEVPETFPFGV
ncbi:MAG: hypothetical protein H7Z39_07465 [Burkholderiaceae bacterium]|nr:hypothetical protein [Burkholderiaceae bacterium]